MTTAPPILALDEPSCGLGVTTKRFVHEAILRVLNRETTLVLTTHEMEEVESLVDQCSIMNLGRVLQIGSVSQLRRQCAVSFDLSLRESEEVIQQIQKLNVVKTRFNQMCGVWTLEIARGTEQL